MTERTEGIKEGLEMAAKWHDEQAIHFNTTEIKAFNAGTVNASVCYRNKKLFHIRSAKILRVRIEEIE